MAIRVLRLFERRGLISPEAACEMASWGHNAGFSVDASVRIEAKDRAGLERLLRYCARPVFASQRLSWAREGEQLRYQLPKPRVDGQTVLCLTPFELLDRLAALIYDCFPLVCPNCGRDMELIAFVTEPSSVKAILGHLGLPIEAPRVAPARGPPDDSPGLDQSSHVDPSTPEPVPEYEFDQRVSW